MIAACPNCNARYRVDPQRIPSGGARLRCARCQALFPLAELAPREAGLARASDGEGGVVVLVADPDRQRAEGTATALRQWGLSPVVSQQGGDAMLETQRSLPRVVILDASLPGMNGSQICEVIQRNPALREITVILVGAEEEPDRVSPSQGFEADAHLERSMLPEALGPILRGVGVSLLQPQPAPRVDPHLVRGTVSQASLPSMPDVPCPPPEAKAAPEKPEEPSEIERAERLARIIVSDIVLYAPEKFAAAAASGDVVEAMEDEIQEGRKLFAQRVPAETRAGRDFLGDEIRRVAADHIAR